LKFFIIVSAVVVPVVTILHFTSRNENKKETISNAKQFNNKLDNNNHSQDNTLLNHPENNIANNNSENKLAKTLINTGNSSLSKPSQSPKTIDQKENNLKTFNDSPNESKPVKNNLGVVISNNSNSLNEELINADVNEGCAPLKVQFSSLTSSDTISYLWVFGDEKSSTIAGPSHVYNSVGSYNVSLTEKYQKSGITIKSIYSKIITVKEAPVAKFDYSFDTQSDIISFTDNSSDAVSWLWTFGDNLSSTDQSPQHEYKQNGTYYIQLAVKNAYGCTDIYSNTITVKLKDMYYIPNAFSPNGDGKDDYFGPVGSDMNPDGYYFMIYNKTGKVVFETNNLNQKWDGKIKGTNTDAQPDMYFWKIKMKDKNGNYQERSGYVTLLKFEQ
jgi:gliding motility-associated-like protein